MNEPETIDDAARSQFNGLMFDVRRSVRYHQHRRRFFENMRVGVVVTALALGTASFIALLDGAVALPLWAKMLPAALGALLMAAAGVRDVERMAGLHAGLARRFVELEGKLEACRPNPTEESLAAIAGDRLAIEADEPPIFRALDMICYNEVVRATYRDCGKHLYEIGPGRRLLAQFVTFHAAEWRKADGPGGGDQARPT